MNWCFQLVTIVTCVLTGLATDLFNIAPASAEYVKSGFYLVQLNYVKNGFHLVRTHVSVRGFLINKMCITSFCTWI